MKQASVQLLPRKKLDLTKWDAAVRRAPYGLSWWLDAATKNSWYGLVLNDYRAVMPLPVSHRLGPLKLINGAPFTQHQGPFGDFRPEDTELFLAAIPKHWYVRKLAVYPPFPLPEALQRWAITARTNHELDLSPDYDQLRRGYRKDLRRKLRDFPPIQLVEWPLPHFLAFYQKHLAAKAKLNNASLAALARLTAGILRHHAGNCYHLTDETGATVSALFVVRHGNRVFKLLAASSPKGFQLHGMARLLDGVVRTHAGTDMVLDFEGSDLPGVASFFRGFGAQRVGYWGVGKSMF